MVRRADIQHPFEGSLGAMQANREQAEVVAEAHGPSRSALFR
jgi:hypothetical protein